MSILSKLMSKHVWNNEELKKKSKQYDKYSIVAMLLIILSAWLSPQYFPDQAKVITLVFVAIAIILMVLSWKTEKDDSKYNPPPDNNV